MTRALRRLTCRRLHDEQKRFIKPVDEPATRPTTLTIAIRPSCEGVLDRHASSFLVFYQRTDWPSFGISSAGELTSAKSRFSRVKDRSFSTHIRDRPETSCLLLNICFAKADAHCATHESAL